MWGDFNARFDGTLRNLDRHRQLIESQFILLQAQQHESDRDRLFRDIKNLEDSLQEARISLEHGEKDRKAMQLRAVQEWIAGYDPTALHERTLQDREEYAQTGIWIKNSEKVANWLNDDLPRSSMLWMHGIPGAGQTAKP